MSDKVVSVTEHALYSANFILEEAGVTVNPSAVYTFTNNARYVGGGSLLFVLNGSVLYGEDTISVKGQDFYRLTIRAATARYHYKETPIVVQENTHATQKTYKFTVASSEWGSVEGNQAPEITLKSALSRGDNKATAIISYSDPENHAIQNIALMRNYISKVKLVFDGTEVKGESFCFMPQQLQWLSFRVPEQGPFSDEVHTRITDIYGAQSQYRATALSVGK